MPKRSSEPSNRYVVNRLNWRRTPAGFVRLPGEVRIASFDTIEEAEAERWRREVDAREKVNPFAAGLAPYEQTNMPPGVYRDWLLDGGIEPPEESADSAAWAKWWEKQSPTWSDDQRARAWEALDKTRFFEVVERARPVVYVIVEVRWKYNDLWYYAEGEGGQVEEVYRSRTRAETVCAERNQEAREHWVSIVKEQPDHTCGSFQIKDRLIAVADPFADDQPNEDEELWKSDEVPFYEVIEVELEGGE